MKKFLLFAQVSQEDYSTEVHLFGVFSTRQLAEIYQRQVVYEWESNDLEITPWIVEAEEDTRINPGFDRFDGAYGGETLAWYYE